MWIILSHGILEAASVTPAFRPDRILIQPKADCPPAALNNLHRERKCRIVRQFRDFQNLQVVALGPGQDVDDAIGEYKASGLVEFAEPDYLLQVSSPTLPNDPRYLDGSQWGLNNNGRNGGLTSAHISAGLAWGVVTGAPDVVVAVIDSGIRYTHEDLIDNMWVNPNETVNGLDDDRNGVIDDIHGLNAFDDTGDPWDAHGHGTHVAGIIGATGNNRLGIAGVAWRVKLMACGFMDASGVGATSDAIQCIDYARNKGAHIINASWGGMAGSTALRAAISRARGAGIIFVAAAGNEGADNDAEGHYPSGFDLDNVVSVGASTRSDALAEFSNYGARTVDLVAPGVGILSTGHDSDSTYIFGSGSSVAAPFVSGALALLRAQFPELTHTELIARLFAAADPLPNLNGKCLTGARLNLHRAVSAKVIANFTISRQMGTPPLSVVFRDTSIGSIAERRWDFGDDSPISSEPNPTHVFDTDGVFTVTLTVTDASGATSVKTRTISALSNYRIAPTDFSWIEPAQTMALRLTDNGVSPAQRLPFPFQFYGQTYERIYVGANGIIGFTASGLQTTSNSDLPNPALPNGVLCPYWDNLNPGAGGSITMGTVGAAPNRQVVVSWVGVPRNSTANTPLTFQAILEETSNRIVFQYLEVQPFTTRGGARGATVGVEAESGLIGAKHIYDGNPVSLNNEQAIVFIPGGPGGLLVTPSSGLNFSAAPGGPLQPGFDLYTLQNNSGSSPLHWTATKTQTWFNLSEESGTLAPGDQITLMVSLTEEAQTLPPGTYLDTIKFTSSGLGATTRTVQLVIEGTKPVLTVLPGLGLTASGPLHGPFSPASQIYTVLNTGDATLEWIAMKSEDWVRLSSAGGSLPPGSSTTVIVSIDPSASDLPVGSYSDEIVFLSVAAQQGDMVRPVTLHIRAADSPHLMIEPVDGQVRLRLTATPGSEFRIETSLDLESWTSWQNSIIGSNGTLELLAPIDSLVRRRFYRAIPSR